MVTNKKKKPLSLEDKSKLVTVYHLLQWKGINASAAALAKEADLTIPSQKPESQSQEVLWSRLPNSPDEESESDSDSSESDSDSSESDSDGDAESSSSERTTIVQKKDSVHPPSAELTVKKLPNAIKKEESSDSTSTSSSSDNDSDSDDEDEETSDTDSSSSSSSDDDESTDSDSSMSDVKAHRAGNNLKRKRPLSSSSESTSSGESDSDSESEVDSPSSSDESSSSSSDDEPPKKVQKTPKKTSATQPPPSPTLSKTLSPPAQRQVASPPQKSSSPSLIHPDRLKIHNGDPKRFSRIKTDIEVHPGVSSNAYNAGASNYGAKAHKDLIVTRGDGFRKEKQKKKRGSYKGGVIDFEARSFKFTD